MWELGYKESWVPKNWCFWTVVLEKILESPLDCKEIQPVHPRGDQFWVFIGRTDVEAETPILWPPDAKSWLIGKDPDVGKDWEQEEKGMTEDETVGWLYHRLDGHGFGWTPGGGDRQGGLLCCGSWGCRVGLNWATELNWIVTLTSESFYIHYKWFPRDSIIVHIYSLKVEWLYNLSLKPGHFKYKRGHSKWLCQNNRYIYIYQDSHGQPKIDSYQAKIPHFLKYRFFWSVAPHNCYLMLV